MENGIFVDGFPIKTQWILWFPIKHGDFSQGCPMERR